MKTKNIAWIVYFIFVLLAIYFNKDEDPFFSTGIYPFGKYIFWLSFTIFTGYTYYCSRNENLFRTIKTMQGLFWGRQIGIDLYIGLLLFIGLIGFHQSSVLIALLWAVPVLAFGNLATLLYLALYYDSLLIVFLQY